MPGQEEDNVCPLALLSSKDLKEKGEKDVKDILTVAIPWRVGFKPENMSHGFDLNLQRNHMPFLPLQIESQILEFVICSGGKGVHIFLFFLPLICLFTN